MQPNFFLLLPFAEGKESPDAQKHGGETERERRLRLLVPWRARLRLSPPSTRLNNMKMQSRFPRSSHAEDNTVPRSQSLQRDHQTGSGFSFGERTSRLSVSAGGASFLAKSARLPPSKKEVLIYEPDLLETGLCWLVRVRRRAPRGASQPKPKQQCSAAVISTDTPSQR